MNWITHSFRIRMPELVPVLLLLALALAMPACSAANKAAQEPAAAAPASEAMTASSDPRAEIDRLWSEIESMQGGGAAAGGERTAVEAVEPMSAPASAEREPMTAGERRPPRPRAAPEPARKIECSDGAEPDTPRCGDVCRVAGSICVNAESICRIAEDLAGDAWAAEKCTSAERACEDAINQCCACGAGD